MLLIYMYMDDFSYDSLLLLYCFMVFGRVRACLTLREDLFDLILTQVCR